MHRAAAAYWRWRVAELPQSRQQAIEDLLEARFHHHAAGDRDEAVEVTEWICLQLDTWGAWEWEQALLMETLAWLPERSAKAAAFQHGLGNVAYFRGDWDDALDWTRKALAIFEQLGARAGMASTLSQIGILHTEGGDPATSPCFNVQSLALRSQIGSPEIRIDLYWLRRQREMLGQGRFRALLMEHLGDEGAITVEQWLQQRQVPTD